MKTNRALTCLLLGINIIANTACFRYTEVPKYIEEPIMSPKMDKRRVQRTVAMTLFTNMSRQPGIEVEFLDKLYHALGNSGFRVWTPLILKMPTREIHEDSKVTIISDYYNYSESLKSIMKRDIHWVVSGYIQDGGAKDIYTITLTTATPNGDVHTSTFRTAQQGNINTIVGKVVERFIEEDKKDKNPPMETYDTGEKVKTGIEKTRAGTETLSEFDLGQTLLIVGGVVLGAIVVGVAVSKK